MRNIKIKTPDKLLMLTFTCFMVFSSCKANNQQDISDAVISEPVEVAGGTIKGIKTEGVTVYKGIPFAAPPVGELRWKAPQPVIPWKGELLANKFGPAPVQGGRFVDSDQQSEDCLYLNIWVPDGYKGEKLPVMVWIYGGAFNTGATSLETYNGINLAKQGVIVVSIGYRVGVFGFMAHPLLSEESGESVSGNYGLLDQIAGLKWVKNNVSTFGGDSNNVTIFGESAGGISVSMLCASPLAKGLFHKAISESGGSFGPIEDNRTYGILSLQGAEKIGNDFISKLGAHSLEEMRTLSAQKIIEADTVSLLSFRFWPVCDGKVIVDDQYKLYSKGEFMDIPVLIGTNSDEGSLFIRKKSVKQHLEDLDNTFGPMKDLALECYPADNRKVAKQSSRNIFRDMTFAWPTYAWANLQTEYGTADVYYYYFDQHPKIFNGAMHASELSYVFDHMDSHPIPLMHYNNEDKALSAIMVKYWTNFAKNGNPNGEGLPEWLTFDNEKTPTMYLKGSSPKMSAIPNEKQMKFAEKYFEYLRKNK